MRSGQVCVPDRISWSALRAVTSVPSSGPPMRAATVRPRLPPGRTTTRAIPALSGPTRRRTALHSRTRPSPLPTMCSIVWLMPICSMWRPSSAAVMVVMPARLSASTMRSSSVPSAMPATTSSRSTISRCNNSSTSVAVNSISRVTAAQTSCASALSSIT